LSKNLISKKNAEKFDEYIHVKEFKKTKLSKKKVFKGINVTFSNP
jgi:hypothetical protein